MIANDANKDGNIIRPPTLKCYSTLSAKNRPLDSTLSNVVAT